MDKCSPTFGCCRGKNVDRKVKNMSENSESTNFDALIDILTSHYSDSNGKEK